ncbi:hypothetical protein [Saccharothrix sp. NRRL B-16314]|uniref:hypothetical protein n=1 Tax=Saccharothrix sp. NRRL B-16314 TaxID=1463825 RepID=UPI000526DC57|nr:hypothetical protein [Saccharothrix sp. NRRL B-16314]
MTLHPETRELWPDVEYRMFVLQDVGGGSTPLTQGIPQPDRLLLPAPTGVVFASAGNDFTPEVLVQVWPSEPPPEPGDWDDVDEAAFHSPSGRVRLVSVQGAPGGPDIPLYGLGDHLVRAYCRGRGEAAERLGIELFYRGVETWLVQVWARPRTNP